MQTAAPCRGAVPGAPDDYRLADYAGVEDDAVPRIQHAVTESGSKILVIDPIQNFFESDITNLPKADPSEAE